MAEKEKKILYIGTRADDDPEKAAMPFVMAEYDVVWFCIENPKSLCLELGVNVRPARGSAGRARRGARHRARARSPGRRRARTQPDPSAEAAPPWSERSPPGAAAMRASVEPLPGAWTSCGRFARRAGGSRKVCPACGRVAEPLPEFGGLPRKVYPIPVGQPFLRRPE